MGLRRKKPPPSATVRAGQVQRLVQAIRDEHYAILCDEGPSGHTEYQRARATLAAVKAGQHRSRDRSRIRRQRPPLTIRLAPSLRFEESL